MQLLSGGTHVARKLKRAQVLLAADRGASDEEIARSIGVGKSTVYRTKRRFVLGNLEAALSEEPRRGAERKFSGKEEALLVATACSSPPAGRARAAWEKRRNADRARIKWMFTTRKARAKMGRAYPKPAASRQTQRVKTSVTSY